MVTDLSKRADTDFLAIQLSLEEYRNFQTFLSQACGIVLADGKQYLVKNRLSGILREFDFKSYTELLLSLQSSSSFSRSLMTDVIDAMTTNETFWFRDDLQFTELKEKVFPELFSARPGTVRIWSAACSSGQEPYTISMCLEDMFCSGYVGVGNKVQIIGTDISDAIIAEAKQAVYSELALSRGLDQASRDRFFQQTHDGCKLKIEVSRRVRFQQFNLLKPFSVLGRFDIIFCRNVLIYFSDDVKKDILLRMASSLETGGYLFLSSTESMPAGLNEFVSVIGSPVRYFKKKS